jgi:hypothetical protein
MKNWEELTAHSELLAAQEIKQSFDEGNLTDVEEGLVQLIETMARSEKRALQSQLIRLMMHVVKWHVQPDRRTRSWLLSVQNARFEIVKLQQYTPSLNKAYIESIWDESLTEAREEAEIETGVANAFLELTWEDVFDKKYLL